MVQGKPTSHTVWSFTLVKCAINFTDRFSLHPETVFWLCKTMGEIQAPHKSHKTKELVSQHLLFSLFCFQVWPEFWVWFQSPDTFCSGQGFQCQGGEEKKAKYCTKKTSQDVIRYAIWHFLPSNSKCTRSLTRTDAHTDRKALACTCTDAVTQHAPVVSVKAHADRHACAR